MWRVAETAWLYVVVDAVRAGHGLVALSVADLDAVWTSSPVGASAPPNSKRLAWT